METAGILAEAGDRKEIDGLDAAGSAIYGLIVVASGAIPEWLRKVTLLIVRNYLQATAPERWADGEAPTLAAREAHALRLLAVVPKLCAHDLFGVAVMTMPVALLYRHGESYPVCATAGAVRGGEGDDALRAAVDQHIFNRFVEVFDFKARPPRKMASGDLTPHLLSGLFADRIRAAPKGRAWVVAGTVAATLWLQSVLELPEGKPVFYRARSGLVIGVPFDLYVNSTLPDSVAVAGYQDHPIDSAAAFSFYEIKPAPIDSDTTVMRLRGALKLFDANAFQAFEVE